MKLKSNCSQCFAGLSCGTRIDIINLLQIKGEMSVLNIVKHFKISQPTMTHHLQYLKDVGVLNSKKNGRYVFYFIHPKCGKNICKIFGS